MHAGAPVIDNLPTPPPDPPAPSPDPSCKPTHTVASGDTLFGIANRYKVNYLTLVSVNPQITNPDLIFPGQAVTVPCLPPTTCARNYIVQSGDTLWAIGNRNGQGLQAMLDANPQFIDPNMIYPGDLVFIPPCSTTKPIEPVRRVQAARLACTAVSTSYTTVPGDSLYR